MATFFNFLAIGSIVAGMVLAFLHLIQGKRTLPFADDSHARTFGWGLLLPLVLMLAYAFREDPMTSGSLGLMVVMVVASAGWFYLSGSYRYSMRGWGMPLWQGMACAQFCGLVVITMGSLFTLSAEDAARKAYLKQHDPARYAAQKKQEQAEAQAKIQREQAWETKQLREAEAEKARKWEEEYQAACRTPEAFLNMAQDIARERLKSPASAKFASWRDPAVKYSGTTDPQTKECVWAVKSYVDSHNSFGAMMRSGFMAEIRLLRDEQMTMRLVDFSAYPMP